MMRIIAQQAGSLRDDNKTCQAISCHVDTFKKLVKSPKAYTLDNGLLTSLVYLIVCPSKAKQLCKVRA